MLLAILAILANMADSPIDRHFAGQAFSLLANHGDGLPKSQEKKAVGFPGSQRPMQEAPVRVELTMSDLQSDALATWLRRRR